MGFISDTNAERLTQKLNERLATQLEELHKEFPFLTFTINTFDDVQAVTHNGKNKGNKLILLRQIIVHP